MPCFSEYETFISRIMSEKCQCTFSAQIIYFDRRNVHFWPQSKMYIINHNDSSKLMVLLQALIISGWFCAGKTTSVVVWGSYTNFRVPNTTKAALYSFKKLLVLKYRTFLSWCVKFYYRHGDLEDLFIFSWKKHCVWAMWCSGIYLVTWHVSRSFSFFRRCRGWEQTVKKNLSRAIHPD